MKGFDKIRDMNLAELEKVSDQASDQTEEDQDLSDGKEAVSQNGEKESKNSCVMEPQGKYYEMNAAMTEEVMRDFFFGHYYRQPIMLALLLIGAVSLGYVFTGKANTPMLYVMISAFIFLGYPLSFFFKAHITVRRNPLYKAPFYYMMDQWGFHLKVETGYPDIETKCLDIEWKRFIKTRRLKKSAVLYTGKNNGYLLPYVDLGDKKEEIIAFCEEKIKNNGR